MSADPYDVLLDSFSSTPTQAPKPQPSVDYRQLYNQVGQKYGVDPDLLYNQAKHESVDFNPKFVYGPGRSPKGAAGLAQFMPDTARQYGLRVGKGQDDRFNPQKAADAHARLMKDLIDKYGDTQLALAAYNSGTNKTSAQAQRAMQRIPETKKYVQKIAPQGDAYDQLLNEQSGQQAAPKRDDYDSLLDSISGQTPTATSQNRVNQPLSPATSPPAAQPRQPSVPSLSLDQALEPLRQIDRQMAAQGLPQTIDAGNAELVQREPSGRGLESSRKAAIRRQIQQHDLLPDTVVEKQAEARFQDEQAENARRAAQEPEVASLTDRYRQLIRATGVTNLGGQWATEALAKGLGGLLEYAPAAVRGMSPPIAATAALLGRSRQQDADLLAKHAEALQRAAVEEGADRNVVSKAIQDAVGGSVAAAPEALLMAGGVPAPLAFGAGGVTRGVGRGESLSGVLKSGAESALSAAPFEVAQPAIRNQLLRRLTRAGEVGAGTTAIDLAQGTPPQQAVSAGLTNAIFGGLSAGKGEPSSLERGLERLPPAEQVQPNAEIAARLRGQRAPEQKGDTAQENIPISPEQSETSAQVNVPIPSEQPQRFFHTDLGEVTESPNQRRISNPDQRVRVVNAEGREKVVRRDELKPTDAHYSNFQERADDGTFAGPPVYKPDVGAAASSRESAASVPEASQPSPRLGVETEGVGREGTPAPSEPIQPPGALAETEGGGREIPTRETPPPSTTGIAHRVETAARGEEPQRGVGLSAEQMVERGRQLPPEFADEAAARFKKSGDISEDAMASVRARHEQLARAANQAFDRHGQNSPEFKQAQQTRRDYYDSTVKPMQTAWSNIGRSQQGETDIDYGTFYGLYHAYEQARGEAPSAKVQADLKQAQGRISDLEARLAEVTKQAEAKLPNVDKFIREHKIALRKQSRARTREGLQVERNDLKQQIATAWKKRNAGVQPSGLASLDPEGELSRLVGKLARNYIEDGVTRAGDLVDAVHAHIADVADLTKREVSDLISGYGRISQPTADPVERKLNELKSILAATSGKADVLEQGIRPLRRGQQREKPTEDQRRALRELQNAMAERPEISKGQPSRFEQQTPLDKAKQSTRNRIEQLQSWIKAGKREVEGRTKVIPDAELTQLRAERDALHKVASLLEDPQADQKAVERRLNQLDRTIRDTRQKIVSGRVAPEVKEGAKSVWSTEIGQMEKEQAALRRIVNDMRQAKPVEKPIGAYGVEGTWKDFEQQAQKVLSNRRRLEKQLSDLQKGAVAKPRKQPEDEIANRLKLEIAREKRRVDSIMVQGRAEKEWAERSRLSKTGAYVAAGTRASVLSGVKTIGKIASALGQRIPQQYAEEVFAKGYRRLLPQTAERAARFGGHMNPASEAAAARGFAAGVKEIPDILKTGETELTRKFGDYHKGIPTKLGRALEVPGRVHFSEKNPLLRAEYERSRELLLQRAERLKPGARTDPLVVDEAERQAYQNAKEVILMGDNPISRAFTRMQIGMGQSSRDLVRTIVPVHRVAGNYISQMIGDYGLGVFRGAVRALNERNPETMKNMAPAEAEKTMRLLQRGSLGLAYLALAGTPIGAALGLKFGGFYKRGRKDEVAPQDIKVGPATIPHVFLHSPPDELAQLGASMQQEWNENPNKDAMGKLWSGVARGGLGTVEQVPFVNDITQVPDALRSGDSLSNFIGRELASRMEPQILRDVASMTDAEKRKPKGIGDQFKMGIPGLRQQVGVDQRALKQQQKATLTDQFRSGKVTSDDLQSLVEQEKLTEADKEAIEKTGNLTEPQAQFNKAFPSQALDRYERMSAAQRADVEDLMTKKGKSLVTSKSLTPSQRDEFRRRLEKVGIYVE